MANPPVIPSGPRPLTPSTPPTSSGTRIKLNPTFWRHGSCVPFSEDVIPSSLFLKHRHFLIMDIETQQLFQDVNDDITRLKISVACAYDSKTDSFLTYEEKDIGKLNDLCEERLVIGYNIRGFDLVVMANYGLDVKRVDAFDIMYDLQALTKQRYLKLDAVAQGTLGVGKSADGTLAVEWWKKGMIQKITEYCLQDVRVTRDVFQFGRQNGFIKIQRAESVVQIPVQWN